MTPPRLACWLLRRSAPRDLRAPLMDELAEAFAKQVAARGVRRARWWYRRQALDGVWSLAALRVQRRVSRWHLRHPASGLARRVSGAWQDLRDARRFLRRQPLATGVALASLAVGIGASTAMFSTVNGVLLRPLDLPSPEQLMLVGERLPASPIGDKLAFIDNPAAYFAWRAQATDFSGLTAIGPSLFTLPNGGQPRLLHGAHVTWNFFDVLGVQPQLGRLLTAADEAGAGRPMVITDALWRASFNADPAIVGRHVGVPGVEATIVGVLPRAFRIGGRELGPMLASAPTEYFDPLRLGPSGDRHVTDPFSNFNYSVIGRLKPGVTPAAALAQLNAIQANLARSASRNLSLAAELTPVRDYAVAAARQGLWLLLAGVLAVQLIVCVNLGGLSVTRVADRRRDWAIRTALGAAPGRLVRQVLLENLLLGLAGGALGVVCAAASLHALLAIAPADIPRLDEVRADWRVLAFGLLLSLATGLLTGAVPAWHLRRTHPQDDLKAASATATSDHGSLRSRQGLIAVQAALSTLLLAVAGLLGVSFYHLVSQPAGFNAQQAIAADVMLGGYPDEAERLRVIQRLISELTALPGVTASGLTSYLPLQGETWIDSIAIPGRVVPLAEQVSVNVRFISPGYLAAIGIPLLAGRDIDAADRPSGPPPASAAAEPPGVVVLSKAAAQMLWPGEPPQDLLGRALQFQNHTVHVAGVVADVRATLAAPPPAVAYSPYWETTPFRVSAVVRTTAGPVAAMASSVRAAIWRVAPLAPIPALRPLDDLATTAVAPERGQFMMLLAFASVALFLAAMGVYALVAHSVLRRRKELALRITLGARAADLWHLIGRQGLGPVAIGATTGVLMAAGAGRLLAAMLFETNSTSPLVLASAIAAVLGAAGAACFLSARRAVAADPWSALRSE